MPGMINMFCLFGIYRLFTNFSLILRRHHHWWGAANFDICSVLMTIEQWGFLSVPSLGWQGESVYNGYLRRKMTLTYIAERLEVDMSLPVFTNNVCSNLVSNTHLPHRATAAVGIIYEPCNRRLTAIRILVIEYIFYLMMPAVRPRRWHSQLERSPALLVNKSDYNRFSKMTFYLIPMSQQV